MGQVINLKIDGIDVQVPEGTLVVDAAKKVGVDIPVFCYHPKMEPVGMCRMCLVEIGRPQINRKSGEFERDEDGNLVLQFGPKLETACTVPVSEGMQVRGLVDKVARARKDIIEFLLTSHPLDCPICDKGGECPLQNLTMKHGSGKSRYLYDEKKHLAKHVPLGELIYLDRERCIQCGRCVRFQDEIVDDPVIGFEQRGRSLQIVSYSKPGFDSYFSGNTTDICPVGALTTSDFRFGARPWEMNSSASICPQCPVGCNLTFNVRREDKSGGGFVIKRALPRQNEWVNEIWICDKGRFAHHFGESNQRLTQPLVKVDGELLPASWDDALDLTARRLKDAGSNLMTVVSGRLSNEDLFNLYALSNHLGGKSILLSNMAGGDLVARVGVGQGTNFSDLGAETTILVVASDLEEEAPIYWLRVKQAAQRGAKLIVANPRYTKLDRYADQILRYSYGAEATLVSAMINSLSRKRLDLPDDGAPIAHSSEIQQAAQLFASAENALIIFGSEGTGLGSSHDLAQVCANLLIVTGHIGRSNNGLIGVWPRANTQGAWDTGFVPVDDLAEVINPQSVLYLAASDPAGDDPTILEALQSVDFLIVQELFLTESAKLADVVFPAQSFIEREGTMTNAEKRVQRFYPAVPPKGQTLPDFAIAAQLGRRTGLNLEERNPAFVMEELTALIEEYSEVSYKKISSVAEQWPPVGGPDLYYGGTSYENSQGLGYQLPSAAERGQQVSLEVVSLSTAEKGSESELVAVPVTILYDRGRTMMPAVVLQHRIPESYAVIHPQTAAPLGVVDGMEVILSLSERQVAVTAQLDETIPQGVVLIPRSMGIALHELTPVSLEVAQRSAV